MNKIISRRDLLKFGALSLVSSPFLRPSLTWAADQSCGASGSSSKTIIIVYLLGGVDGYRLFPAVQGPLSSVLATRRSDLIPGINDYFVPHQAGFGGNTYGVDKSLYRLLGSGIVPASNFRMITDVGITDPLKYSRSHKEAQDKIGNGRLLEAPGKKGWLGALIDSCNLSSMQVFGLGDLAGKPYLTSDEVSVLQARDPRELSFYNRWFGGTNCNGCAPNLDDPNDRWVSASDDQFHALDTIRGLNQAKSISSAIDQAAVIADENLQTTLTLFKNEIAPLTLIGDYRTQTEINGGGGIGSMAYFQECCKLTGKIMKWWSAKNASQKQSQVIFMGLDGFDTHSNQNIALPRHLEALDGGLAGLKQDIQAVNAWNDTTIVVVSEFGRKINSNSGGTDHGCANNSFAIGGRVNGGISGTTPNLSAFTTNDFVVPQTSIFDVLVDALQWAGFDASGLFDEMHGSGYRSLFI